MNMLFAAPFLMSIFIFSTCRSEDKTDKKLSNIQQTNVLKPRKEGYGEYGSSIDYGGSQHLPDQLAYDAVKTSYEFPEAIYGSSKTYDIPKSYEAPQPVYGPPQQYSKVSYNHPIPQSYSPPSSYGSPHNPSQSYGHASYAYESPSIGYEYPPSYDQSPLKPYVPTNAFLNLYDSLPSGFKDMGYEKAIAFLLSGIATKKTLIVGTLAIVGAITLMIKGLIVLKFLKIKKILEFITSSFIKPKELETRAAKMMKLAANVLQQIDTYEDKLRQAKKAGIGKKVSHSYKT